MKRFYSEAKIQIGNCVLDDAGDSEPPILEEHSNNNFSHHHNHNNHSFVSATTSTAYDTLQHPFKSDKNRGRWSSAVDFYFACTSHAFGSIVFSELPVFALMFGGAYFLAGYLIAILLYAIPVFVIQTFLGQFSTSGIISALRVAPIFKGIGYSILFLNLTTLTYYAVTAAVPLIYAVNALNTVIPWMSCDNAWNTPQCSTNSTYDEEDVFVDPHSTVEFFRFIIKSNEVDGENSNLAISWPVLCGVIVVWLLTLGILLKRVSFIGKYIRCSCILMIAVFIAIFAYVVINADMSWELIISYFKPSISNSYTAIRSGVYSAILMSTWLIGPGWGNVLTLASYNRFHNDSERMMYWVSGTHIVLTIMALICGRIALDNFEDHIGLFHFHVEEQHYMQFLYLCFAYLFGSFTSLPNFWCVLFFAMLFIAELSAVIVQMMTVLSALFDEYVILRSKKTCITFGLVMFMMIASIYFCTKQGFEHLNILSNVAILTHVTIFFVLLLMTTWIYGRERFQRDLQFMLGKTISNFKMFLIRFITPEFLIISMLQLIVFIELDSLPEELPIFSLVLAYIIILGYMIYKVCQTTGTIRSRIKQCLEPQDWHPVDGINRRFYDEVMGTSEMLVLDHVVHQEPFYDDEDI